ncbi:hypothetical protein [Serratia sp. BW106]|uniref:hypothetical protein n=1 Tax=Serratia sp. BW106 TaxID=1884636 RepID=UPI0018E0A3D8|nr:hypothetical protein [Serratia sp. BW106]
MPDLIPTLKKIFFLKKSNNTHNSLIYLNSQNNKFRWCMGIASPCAKRENQRKPRPGQSLAFSFRALYRSLQHKFLFSAIILPDQ